MNWQGCRWLWIPVLLLGIGLRFFALSDPPLHADEAVGAKITAGRLEGRGYDFRPSHFHGPTLSWIAAGSAALAGQTSFAQLDVFTLRTVAALCGSLVVVLPFLLRRSLGEMGALLGGLFLAVSPLLCAYSRVFIHEPLLTCFAAATLVCLGWWLHSRNPFAAVCGGFALGLMAATKETFAITAFSWFIGLLAVWRHHRGHGLAVAALCSSGAFVMTLFAAYGNPLHFFSTFVNYATDPAHARSAFYYWDLLIALKHRPPQWWSEAGMAVLAIAGVWTGWRKAETFLRLLAVSTAVQLAVYSAIAYKTPWLMMVPWMQLCLLAGAGAAGWISAARGALRVAGIALVSLVVLFQLQQTTAAVFRFPNDVRNPLVYSPTAPDIVGLRDRLQALKNRSPSFRSGRIAILGSGYWPLPWYLRGLVETGYFEEPPGNLESFAVVIAMPDSAAREGVDLSATHEMFYYGLRHEVPVTVFIRNDVREEEVAGR